MLIGLLLRLRREWLVLVDELSQSFLFLFFLLNLLVELLELSNEHPLLLMLLLGSHKELLIVNLSLDFLFIVKNWSFHQGMVKLVADREDSSRERIVPVFQFVYSAVVKLRPILLGLL